MERHTKEGERHATYDPKTAEEADSYRILAFGFPKPYTLPRMYILLFAEGIIVGFFVAVPVGPVAVLCIRRTLAHGRLSGYISGLGAATADGLYAAIATFGLTSVGDILLHQQFWLRVIGGCALILMGIKTYRAKMRRKVAPRDNETLLRDYGSTLLLTLANPMTIIAFAAIYAGLGLKAITGNFAAATLLFLGTIVGSAMWWIILAELICDLRPSCNHCVLLWLNRIAGVAIAVFGVLAMVSVLWK